MRLALVLSLCAAPVMAQDTAPAPVPEDDGFSLVEEGARMVLRGLFNEMQPALNEMGKALDEVGPALEGFGEEMGKALDEVGPALEGFGEEIRPKIAELIAMIDDFRNYDAPVMLPNGDILIRRNAPLVPKPAVPDEPVPGPNGEIEL